MIETFGSRVRALPAARQLPQAGQPLVGAALDHHLDERSRGVGGVGGGKSCGIAIVHKATLAAKGLDTPMN